LSNLTNDGGYWKKNHKELQCHLLKKYTKFWEKGFEILQNIEDRAILQKHVKRARDPISMVGPRGAPTTCLNQHGALQSYSFGQI
jgi:hypothetical protein